MNFFSLGTYAQSFTISGFVKDASNGENLIGASIYDVQRAKGTVSNAFGFYSITLPAGEVRLRASYVGFQEQELVVQLTENVRLNFELQAGSPLAEVVVTATEKIERSPQMSTIDVPIEQIESIPALLGEPDVLKALQLLPGVQVGTEGTSGLYVRGGGPDQNLIWLDGVPVYNVSHLFGFFSIFNADAVNRVSLVKGGFPARYGGRLSSVIDISMKEGNNQRLSGEGAIGLIASKLTLEGPIGKNKRTTFIVSGRRTYIDVLAKPFTQSPNNTAGYYFYDVNAKMNHTFSQNDRLYLSFYNGRDRAYGKSSSSYQSAEFRGSSRSEFGLGWGNTIAALRWNHIFNPKLFANLTGTYSKYKFRTFSEYQSSSSTTGEPTIIRGDLLEYFSGVEDVGLKLDFDFLPSPAHNIRFGVSATQHAFTPGIIGFDSYGSGLQDLVLGGDRTQAFEYFVYAEDDLELSRSFRANGGLHYSGFVVNGRLYQSLQPRVSMRYLLTDALAVKGSFASMNQYIHLLTNGGLGLPTDLWVPATDRIRPQSSWQGALGLARSARDYEVSVEAYYKEMDGLIEYREGATYFNLGADWQDKVTRGEGTSYGTELFVQKKTGRLSGWMGYTLSWAHRQFDDLNFGRQFPYRYDRRHDLSIVGIFKVNETLTASSTWVYGTGSAVTIPQATYASIEDDGNLFFDSSVQDYGDRNGYRMPAYHRLDVGLTWKKKKKWGYRSWSVGAYNLYNRKNPFFIDERREFDGDREFYQYSLFPVLPYFRYSFSF